MSEGTTRGEAAAHILARETGRRMRAVQARIDEVEEQRKAALDVIASRLTEHDGSEARQDGLIDGLRADLGTVQAVTSAIDAAHGETRELTAAQAQELVRIAQRLTVNEAVDARQDGTLAEVLDRVDVLEATAPVPGPKGDRGERGERGPRGLMGPPGIPGSGSGGSGSGGSGAINSVTASSGLTVTGTSDLTITNTGVRSLTGSGLTVSASTGDVTLTAPTVTGGTGISVAGSGTTSITVSATGVNSVSAGTGISVSGTTALTVSASLAAGSGIGISGTTTLTVSNTGVTSIVAGTNVSVSGATGAVTVNAPAFATAGSSAVGDSAAAGTATTAARSDHVHGREAFGTPGASAVADTASAGTATTVARSDHRHSREAFGTTITASTIGGTAAAGTSVAVAREDHKHAFPAGAAPSALTVSSTQATGTSTAPALADHVHAMPGSAIAGASAVGDTAATGTATTVALSDHRHSREAFGTPVVVNGQTTSLATGSLTTLARADHVHTMSNVPVLLASTTVSSSTTSIVFSSIPQTYRSLRLIWSGAVTGAVSWTQTGVRFNGDSAPNYYFQFSSTVYTSAYVGFWAGASTGGGGAGASYSGNDMVIHDYTSTNRRKGIVGLNIVDTNSTSTPTAGAGFYYNLWAGNAAITSITLIDANGSLIASGSTAALYGMP